MDGGLWIDAPSATQAQRLVELLQQFETRTVKNGHAHEVHVYLDNNTGPRLMELFDGVNGWLSDDSLGACQVHFGERTYTLLRPNEGQPSDPRDFLLERTIQLQRALDSRIVIEQAKGMLAHMLDIQPDEAFELLRKHATADAASTTSRARSSSCAPFLAPGPSRDLYRDGGRALARGGLQRERGGNAPVETAVTGEAG